MAGLDTDADDFVRCLVLGVRRSALAEFGCDASDLSVVLLSNFFGYVVDLWPECVVLNCRSDARALVTPVVRWQDCVLAAVPQKHLASSQA